MFSGLFSKKHSSICSKANVDNRVERHDSTSTDSDSMVIYVICLIKLISLIMTNCLFFAYKTEMGV